MIIGVDIDNTLTPTMESVAEAIGGEGTTLQDVEFAGKSWPRIGKASPEDVARWYAENSDFEKDLPIYPGVLLVLSLLGHDVHLISARDNERQDIAAEWVAKWKVPHVSLNIGVKEGKAALCEELGVQVMLEDNWSEAKDIADRGIKVLLHNMPYNRGVEHENITRFSHWGEVPRILRRLSAAPR